MILGTFVIFFQFHATTYAAVFNALLRHLVESGACDRDWISANTTGFADTVGAAMSLAEAAAIAEVH